MSKKKVVLLGDSIRLMGYGIRVPEILGDEYEVYQPEDNCRFCHYLFRKAFDMKNVISGADLIHFNSGEWDVSNIMGDGPFTSPEEYVYTMKRIAKLLLSYSDKVVFATTTPVKPGHIHNSNDTIKQYNELIVPIYKEMGIIINDLGALVETNVDDYIREDDRIHLTDKGIEVCAKQTCEVIKELLKDEA